MAFFKNLATLGLAIPTAIGNTITKAFGVESTTKASDLAKTLPGKVLGSATAIVSAPLAVIASPFAGTATALGALALTSTERGSKFIGDAVSGTPNFIGNVGHTIDSPTPSDALSSAKDIFTENPETALLAGAIGAFFGGKTIGSLLNTQATYANTRALQENSNTSLPDVAGGSYVIPSTEGSTVAGIAPTANTSPVSPLGKTESKRKKSKSKTKRPSQIITQRVNVEIGTNKKYIRKVSYY